MKRSIALAAAVLCSVSVASATDRPRVTGEYVEARTAEVFAGGCIMNSEAETAGREAVLAWKVTTGRLNGVALDGLSVAVAVAGERNLGMREMGGEEARMVRAVISVDARGDAAQRDALAQLARDLSAGLITHVARVDVAPVRFNSNASHIDVGVAGVLALTVNKELKHDASCGAMQWFKPFSSRLTGAAMGTAEAHAFSGTGLGSKWSAPNKRSAFWGTFAY
jgi:hypothetical protein